MKIDFNLLLQEAKKSQRKYDIDAGKLIVQWIYNISVSLFIDCGAIYSKMLIPLRHENHE